MVAKQVNHVVKRPGRRKGDDGVSIPIAGDLSTRPGIPANEPDVDFYSRKYPLEDMTLTLTADSEWSFLQGSVEDREAFRRVYRMLSPIVKAGQESGELEPENEPKAGQDVTQKIRDKARDLGFCEVGFTRYDRRYTYKGKKRWVKYEHAICLALEQDYERTQAIPSTYAEDAALDAYGAMSQLGLVLADYIRSLGYHAQVHGPLDTVEVVIPMFVAAGLGQLGANGQLLSPHFGSRARLMTVTTDALVTYDEPVDYGIHQFCQVCQVCVNRCPGRALQREKVWWRGVEKNKLVYERCRPVMARFSACGVCMKVCPVQKYGLMPVMEHYVETGEVLGKGTHALEGYELEGKGYFGPDELPHFDHDFFDLPHGKTEDVLFKEFKAKLKEHAIAKDPLGDVDLREFREKVEKALRRNEGSANPMSMVIPDEE